MENMKIEEWNPKPLTIGLWRPYRVEVGFIEDYINRSVSNMKQNKPECNLYDTLQTKTIKSEVELK